jgi:hypothetical protein
MCEVVLKVSLLVKKGYFTTLHTRTNKKIKKEKTCQMEHK